MIITARNATLFWLHYPNVICLLKPQIGCCRRRMGAAMSWKLQTKRACLHMHQLVSLGRKCCDDGNMYMRATTSSCAMHSHSCDDKAAVQSLYQTMTCLLQRHNEASVLLLHLPLSFLLL